MGLENMLNQENQTQKTTYCSFHFLVYEISGTDETRRDRKWTGERLGLWGQGMTAYGSVVSFSGEENTLKWTVMVAYL